MIRIKIDLLLISIMLTILLASCSSATSEVNSFPVMETSPTSEVLIASDIGAPREQAADIDDAPGALHWNNSSDSSNAIVIGDSLYFGGIDYSGVGLVFCRYDLVTDRLTRLQEESLYSYVNYSNGSLFGARVGLDSEYSPFFKLDGDTAAPVEAIWDDSNFRSHYTVYSDYVYCIEMNSEADSDANIGEPASTLLRHSLSAGSDEIIAVGNISWFSIVDGYIYHDDHEASTDKEGLLVRRSIRNIKAAESIQLASHSGSVIFYKDKIYSYESAGDGRSKIYEVSWSSSKSELSDIDISIIRFAPFKNYLYYMSYDSLYRLSLDNLESELMAVDVSVFYAFDDYVFYKTKGENSESCYIANEDGIWHNFELS